MKKMLDNILQLLELEIESFDKIERENPTNNNVWRTNQLYNAYMKIKDLKDENNKEDEKNE
jgi:hypothetical protein